MKKLLIRILFTCAGIISAQAQTYTATPENLVARKEFQDMKLGMFIHWGASSVLGNGEWVMNNRNIGVNEYGRLIYL